MPKDKAEMMKVMYKHRKDAGLSPHKFWLTPSDKLKADKLYSESESAKIERARKGE